MCEVNAKKLNFFLFKSKKKMKFEKKKHEGSMKLRFSYTVTLRVILSPFPPLKEVFVKRF